MIWEIGKKLLWKYEAEFRYFSSHDPNNIILLELPVWKFGFEIVIFGGASKIKKVIYCILLYTALRGFQNDFNWEAISLGLGRDRQTYWHPATDMLESIVKVTIFIWRSLFLWLWWTWTSWNIINPIIDVQPRQLTGPCLGDLFVC